MNLVSGFIKKTEGANKELFFIQALEDNIECWHYILIHKLKTPLFKQKLSQTPCRINLEEFGKVVYSGWGKEPSLELKKRIEGGDYSQPEKTNEFKVMHVQNEQNGIPFYAFVAVKWEMAEKFEYIANYKGNINLSDWGTVLEIGWGPAPQNRIDYFSNLENA